MILYCIFFSHWQSTLFSIQMRISTISYENTDISYENTEIPYENNYHFLWIELLFSYENAERGNHNFPVSNNDQK